MREPQSEIWEAAQCTDVTTIELRISWSNFVLEQVKIYHKLLPFRKL